MKKMNGLRYSNFLWLLLAIPLLSWKPSKPALYLIGDSTVKNGQGDGSNGQWGWGSFIHEYLDTTKLHIENHALGGTSSRTFRTRGLWDKVLDKIEKGDILIIQFGHNDGGPLDDTARARGTIRGIGDETKDIYNPITKRDETVHTYGWYLSSFIIEAKAKGAYVYVCSLVPRNNWRDGLLVSNQDSYPTWAKQVAEKQDAYYIPLNEQLEERYNQLGQANVKALFPETDHTHTNMAGAKLSAQTVIKAIRNEKENPLKQYVRTDHED